MTVIPAVYNFTLRNPNNSINISGSGDLFEGILTNFINLRSRSIKTKFPTQIELKYNSSLLRVYSNNNYDVDPRNIVSANWVELPTSPFFPDTESNFSLHPTTLNGDYGFTLTKLANYPGSWTCYLVVAPPSFCVEYRMTGIFQNISFKSIGILK